MEQNKDKHNELKNGLVYRKINGNSLLYVPETMCENIIRASHEQVGRQGINKICEHISRPYWYPAMRSKVQLHVVNCLKCITSATTSNRIEDKLQDKGNKPFLILHTDHYGPLEKSGKRHKYIVCYDVHKCRRSDSTPERILYQL